MKTSVSFMYNESACKWEVVVSGVKNAAEASEAFSAVLITCGHLMSDQSQAFVIEKGGNYKIIPAVTPGSIASRSSSVVLTRIKDSDHA